MSIRTLGVVVATAIAVALGSAAANAKTFVFCSEGSPEGFNPSLYTTGTTFDASSRALMNRLVAFKLGTTEIAPGQGLATSWTISDDGTEYTFKLREGVKWHSTKSFKPSRDFNADDVLYSFNRQWKPEAQDHGLSGGTYEYFNSMGFPELLKSIEKIDDHTVKFTLTRPEAPFLADLGMDFASIMSKEYSDAMNKAGTPEKIDQDPVGTGPFQLVNYQKDAVIRYKAFADYWGEKPKIDTLVFAITPDAAVAFAKLLAGECHLIPYPNAADLDGMKKDPNLKVMSAPGLNIGYLGFNTEKQPLTDKRVRQALNMAINKPAIIEAVYIGTGQVAKNPIPPIMWSYNDAIKDYPYDPEQARKLLADAGYKNGFKTDIWAMPVKRPYNPNARRMAEMIQSDWKAVGVDASIVSFEWGEYLKRTVQGEHQTFMLGWTGDNGDPDNFLYTLLSCDAAKNGINRARWCYKPFDELVLEAKRISDQGKRAELYEKAQVVFKEEAPWVTIAHSTTNKAMRNSVQGFVIDPFGGHHFDTVDLSE